MKSMLELRSDFLEKLLTTKNEEFWYWDFQIDECYKIEGLNKIALPYEDLMRYTLVHPKERDVFKRIVEKMRAGKSDLEKHDFRMLPNEKTPPAEANYILYSIYFMAETDELHHVEGLMICRRNVNRHLHLRKDRDELFAKYSSTLNNMLSGLCYFDDSGRVLEANPVGERILSEVFQRDVYQLNILEISAFDDEMIQHIRHHQPLTRVFRFNLASHAAPLSDLAQNDSVFFAEMHYLPVNDADGNFLTNLIVSKDVTMQEVERLRNEKYLTQIGFINEYLGVSQVVYYLSTRSYNVQYYHVKDSNWRSVPINHALEKVHPADKAVFRQMMADADQGEKPTLDTRVRMQLEGYEEYRNVHFLFLRDTDRKDRTVSYSGVMIDLTEHIVMKTVSDRVYELLYSIINSIPALVFVKDVARDFRFVLVNREFAEKYGHEPEECVNQTDADLLRLTQCEDPLLTDEACARMLTDWASRDREALNYTQESPLEYWEEFTERDGSVTYLKTDKFRCQLHGRDLLIGVSINVTDLQAARLRAEQSDKLKGAFLMNMSHEIRTPLNAIVGFSELLLNATDKHDKDTYMDLIRTNNNHLLDLIGNVLDLAQLESGNVVFERQPILVKAFVDELYQAVYEKNLVEPTLPAQVQLLCDSPQTDCTIYQDAKHVYKALMLFVNNAIKFTTRGSITIGYTPEPNGVRLWVRDTGLGISEENRRRIFERFEKVDAFIPGTGLGLSICKSIADAMQGHVGVESEPGKGSTFWLWLPVGEA